MLAFAEIDPGADGPPQQWIETMGLERAKKKFRVAQAGWLDPRKAPVALSSATKLAIGIAGVRSRAHEKGGGVTVNVGIALPVPEVVYKRKVIQSA